MAENIQKIKTRYPFGGFYLELLPEAERKELESMPEEVLLSESKITTVRPIPCCRQNRVVLRKH